MADDEKLREVRALLRDRPTEARRRATRLMASADPRTAALARFVRGDARQALGELRDAAEDYAGARRSLEALAETGLARLVDLSDLQVQCLLGNTERFRAAAARLRRWFRDSPRRVVVEQAIGNAWRAMGREDKAEECFREALRRIGRRRDDRSRLLRALVGQDLGVCLAYRGSAAEAVRLLDRARQALAALGAGHTASVAAANLAWAQGIAGDLANACAGLPAAARLLQRHGDRRRALLARLDAADLHRRLGDYGRAAREGSSVARALARLDVPSEEARARLLVARSRAARGRVGPARAEARRAARLSARAGDDAGVVAAELVAGSPTRSATRTLLRAGLYVSAVDSLLDEASRRPPRRAARLLADGEQRLPAALRAWLRPDRYRWMAEAEPARRIAWLRRAVRAAETVRERAPTAALRATSMARHLELYESLAGALLERGRARDRREAFAVLDAARARTMREELERQAPGIGSSRRIRELRARLEQLWNALDQQEREPPGVRGAAAPLLRRIRKQERELADAFRDQPAGVAAAPGSWGDTLAYARIGSRCVGLLARDGDVESWDAGGFGALLREMESFRFQVRRRLHGATDARAIEGVLARLADAMLPADFDPPERLRVVLPAALGDLPIEAMPHRGTPLLDRSVLEYAPCAAWRTRAWRRTGANTIVGLSARGLPEIDGEVDLVARLLGGARRVQGDAATRAAVLDVLRGSRIVHVAGHAEARDDAPVLSALRVHDGWLAAADFSVAPLRGALMVLSACRTGDPALQWQGESMGGFPRALLAAGAAGIVASRWPVDDRLAREWMTEMYRVLPDLGPVAAVRAAARAIRVRQRHPADWACFLYVPGWRTS
ncbi:MAG: CHAT domain-containing protein [Planctomycetota bacterium]|jgi:tetratricopeptide (TPR) repeat protein